MTIILGHNLDGAFLPPDQSGIDQLICGPCLLLDQLEMRLGLPMFSGNDFALLSAFINATHQACSDEETFYSESFQVDSFATGKQLFQLRNQLHLYGWDGKAPSRAPEKIKQLAEIESLFTDTGKDTSEPSRLRAIINSITQGLDLKIDTINLVDPIDSFAPLWQQLLKSLPIAEADFPSLSSNSTNKLGLLQQNLNNETTPSPDQSSNDHSIRIFQSRLELTNCKAVAQLISSYINKDESVTIIASQQSRRALDDYLAQANLPRIGHRVNNSAGSFMQMVVLYLRLHWAPTDPQHWLEFLLHPVSPLPKSLSFRLAKALDRVPSLRSQAWQNAIDHYIENAEKKTTAKKLIQTWLSPAGFDESSGDSSSFIASIDSIANWLERRGKDDSEPAAAARSIRSTLFELRNALSNNTSISRIEWDRLVAEWLAHSSINRQVEAELSPIQVVNSPAQIISPVDHIIWWQPERTSFPDSNWTTEELDWLSSQGITTNWREQQFTTSERQSNRPVFHAHQSLTFVITQSSQQESPPLLERARAILGDTIVHDPESILDSITIDRKPLPTPLTSIQISHPDLLESTRAESFSSLFKYLYHPLTWVLDYQANLQEGPAKKFRIINDAKRRGSLLHGFVESLLEPENQNDEANTEADVDVDTTDFNSSSASILETLVTRLFGPDKTGTPWNDIYQAELNEWVESQWDDLLADQAAHLLVKGSESSRYELLTLACDGLWSLIKYLDSADVVDAVCEREIQPQTFVGGEIRGFIDLQVTNEKGETALIDLKLGGKRNKQEELKKGCHLQLATYGHLVNQTDAIEASTAYFIFMGGGILLARSNDFFPDAEVWINSKGQHFDDWDGCWQDFERLWQRRHQQLEQGLIEIPNENTDPLIDMGSWTIKEADKYSPYKNLKGWEESA